MIMEMDQDFNAEFPQPGPPPRPPREPDPGSPLAALLAWLVLAPLIVVVVLLNQLPESVAHKTAQAAQATTGEPSSLDPFVMSSKMAVKLSRVPGFEELGSLLIGQVDGAATTPLQRLRAAIVCGEVASAKEALKRLDGLEKELETSPDDDLLADIAVLRRIYDDRADEVPPRDRERFVKRHGWFGQLAQTHGQPNTEPARAALISGGLVILTALMALGAVLGVGVLGGLTCFILALIYITGGNWRRRFAPPAPGGSVYLETVALFIAVFLLMKVVAFVVVAATGATEPPPWLIPVQMAGQWLTILLCLWPMVRGVPWARLRRELGLYADRGVFREIGCGIVGYMAGLPLFFVAALVTALLVFLRGLLRGPAAEPPGNPIADLIGSA